MISSIDEQRAFVRDTAGRYDEVEGNAGDADESWNIGGMVFVCEVAGSGALYKLKKVSDSAKIKGRRC